MDSERIAFRVTALSATIPEGILLEWRGREVPSGPLTIELDEDPEREGNLGVLDYSSNRARADFRVRILPPEPLADLLQELGVTSSLICPVQAVVHSEGEILDDQSLLMSGPCEVSPHGLFETLSAGPPGG